MLHFCMNWTPATPSSPSLRRPCTLLCFHTVTNCKFSISFLLTFIQNAGGVGGTFSPSDVQLRTLHPGCIFGMCGRSKVQTILGSISFLFISFRTLLHFFALSCTHAKFNSFVFKQFRTLWQKTRGGGHCFTPCSELLGVGRAGLGRSYQRTFRRLPDLVRTQGTFL
jgi:hypothetical protein